MGTVSVRNIPDEDLAALKRIAAANNRSTEAEIRQAIAAIALSITNCAVATRDPSPFELMAAPVINPWTGSSHS